MGGGGDPRAVWQKTRLVPFDFLTDKNLFGEQELLTLLLLPFWSTFLELRSQFGLL